MLASLESGGSAARLRRGERLRAALAAALVAAAAFGCRERGAVAPPTAARPGFDGARAFSELEELVRIGPRPAGSAGAARARELIRERLRQAGWVVEEHAFEAGPPGAKPLAMINLIARREDSAAERVVLITHYDTKDIPGIRFVGANDGASGTAVLLELARALAAQELPLAVELVFADGEEAVGESITAQDGLYGSHALAERMRADASLERVRAVILVDMVGDADLNLVVDQGSSPLLRGIFAREAERLGLAAIIDPTAEMTVIDDHTPFAARGVEHVLALIDFQFGGRVSPGRLWHTEGDSLESVSASSLNSVGRVLVETVRAVSEHWRSADAPRARGE